MTVSVRVLLGGSPTCGGGCGSMEMPTAGDGPILTVRGIRILVLDAERGLYVGPRPCAVASVATECHETLSSLAKEARVTAIVDLNADEAERIAAEGGGLAYRGINVEDNGEALAPSILESASRAVRELLDSGHRVYLHCTFGKGRSPTVAAAYLIAYRGMSALAAREHIEELDSKWLHRGIWSGYDARFPGRLQEFERWVRRETNG